MRALFLVLYCTGLRIGEALRLRLVNVDLGRACFRIGPSKGRVRLVPFGRDLALELKHWLNRRHINIRFTLRNEYPATENRLLRKPLKDRPRLTDDERITLAEIGHRLGRKALAEVACFQRTSPWLRMFCSIFLNLDLA